MGGMPSGASPQVVGGFAGLLRLSLQTAALLWALACLLLACDGCHANVPDEAPPDVPGPVITGLDCRLGTPVVLAGSEGTGPVRALATDDAVAVLHRGRDERDQPAVLLTRLSEQLAAAPPAVRVGPTTAGELLPDSLLWQPSGLTAVLVQSGGRRVYLYSQAGTDDLLEIALPDVARFDRRAHLTLASAQTAGGLLVLLTTSGSGTMEVGRLAGTLLATQTIELPDWLTEPLLLPSTGGGAAIISLERGDTGGRQLVLYALASDFSLESRLVVADLADSERVDRLSGLVIDDNLWLSWHSQRGTQTSLERARVEPATGLVERQDPLLPSAGTTLLASSTARVGEEVWTVWAESPAVQSALWLYVAPLAADTESTRLMLRPPGDARLSELALVGSPHFQAVVWRELGEDNQGPVMAAEITCRAQ